MNKVFILAFIAAISSPAALSAQGTSSAKECVIDFFNADPIQVSPGASAILNWSTSNCSNVTIIGGNLSGYRAVSGNMTTGPLGMTTTFTLTAANTVNTTSRELTVQVQQPAAPVSSTTPPVTPPVTAPPPVEPPVPAATTTTTVTTSTTPAAIPPPPAAPATTATVVTTNAATPVYDLDPRPSINVNRLRFGAFVAPNISWMKPTTSTDDKTEFDVSSNGSKVGFTYGLMGEYFFAPNYGIVSGISINQTGGKILATNKDQTIAANKVLEADFNYRLQYLDIPLALKLRTDDINGFRFFGQLGISLGINIAKKADYTVTYVDESAVKRDTSGTKIKIQGDLGAIAPIMFQMNIGAGAEYPINNKLSFYIGVFFNNGFAPDATKPDQFKTSTLGYDGEFRDANTRLNNLALRLGLFF